MIRFPCNICGKKLKAPPNAIGRRCKCPRCGTSVTIQPETTASGAPPPRLRAPEPVHTPPQPILEVVPVDEGLPTRAGVLASPKARWAIGVGLFIFVLGLLFVMVETEAKQKKHAREIKADTAADIQDMHRQGLEGRVAGDANKEASGVPGGVGVPAERAENREDWSLWSAGMAYGYTLNRANVPPENPNQHADLLVRHAAGLGWKTDFAKAIMAREYVDHLHAQYAGKEKKLQSNLPTAWNRSTATAARMAILGKEPTWEEIIAEEPKGGLLDTIDQIRKAKVAVNILEIYHHRLTKTVTDVAEEQLRKNARPLPDDARLFIDGEMGTAKISYVGKRPLTNIVVVTRATMKPPSREQLAAQAASMGFNELFDSGAERNQMAALYMQTSRQLHETPQGTYYYAPVLESGDVLEVLISLQVSFWDIQETRISLYSDAGSVLDKILMVGGPENDLSLTPAERKARSKPRPEEPLVGPVFEPVYRKLELTLKPGATGPFERCVPAGKSYLLLGVQDALEPNAPITVVAKNQDGYVVVGPKRPVGHGLAIVPASVVDRVNDLTPKPPEKTQLKYELLQPVKWVLLRPAPDEANIYKFQTVESAVFLRHTVNKTGRTVEVSVPAGQSLRAFGTTDDYYFVTLPKRASDGSIAALVPKSLVQEVRAKK